MARPRVATCARKCKGKKMRSFRACVRACAKKGGSKRRRRRRR
jgi:hypothetical protein